MGYHRFPCQGVVRRVQNPPKSSTSTLPTFLPTFLRLTTFVNSTILSDKSDSNSLYSGKEFGKTLHKFLFGEYVSGVGIIHS